MVYDGGAGDDGSCGRGTGPQVMFVVVVVMAVAVVAVIVWYIVVVVVMVVMVKAAAPQALRDVLYPASNPRSSPLPRLPCL